MVSNEKNTHTKKKNYIKRSIIKLGSSYAITYPTDFLDSFSDESGEIKGINVHCYKIDPMSILIKKLAAESEVQTVTIKISEFPMDLLESLLESTRKLNVNKVVLEYEEKDYEKTLEIINKFGLTPVHSEGKMIVDLSRQYKEYNFPDQINSMVKNFSKIIQITFQISNSKVAQKSIDTFLIAIKSSFKESLRVLIMRLKNYYLINENGEDSHHGMQNIINILGNRVLISHIKNMSISAGNLFLNNKSPEIKKYEKIIIEFPKLLKEEVDLILSKDIGSRIEEINEFKNTIEKHYDEYIKIQKKCDKDSVDESVINARIFYIMDILFDIHEIILTRWIENTITVE